MRILGHLLPEWLKRHLRPVYGAYRLRRALRASRGLLRIVVGAGGTSYSGWIPTEFPLVDVANLQSLKRFFRKGSVDAVLAEHVWEHLSLEQAAAGARNCNWLLKSGGRLRIAVPDGLHPDKKYIEEVRPGGHGEGSDDHKVLYTYRSLRTLLESAGFRVNLLEWFDVNGEFQYREWDPSLGFVARSTRFDERNATNPTAYTSIIADAVKD
jgi:predicted SAM-dependent methyltransferase